MEKVLDWPGLNSARQLLDQTPLEGTWISHTYEYRQQRSGEEVDPEKIRSTETLHFSPLPCWSHLTPESYRDRIADLVDQIEHEAAADRQATGKKVLGKKAILRKNPHYKPPKEKRSRRPLSFAASKEAYKRLQEAFRDFFSAYREASARLREGHLDAVFPENCIPPGLPFTGTPRAGPETTSTAAHS